MSFDPYRKWLSIPEDFRPPTHYQLLGVSVDERDLEVIDAAVLRQSAYVRNFQTGKFAADATRILNEIAAAKLCILDPAKRAAYDAELKRKGIYPQPAHETPVAPLAPEPRSQPMCGPPPPARTAPVQAQPARTQPVAPKIDLEALAGQAGARSRRSGPQVRLPSRSRNSSLPLHYWLIPAAITGLLVIFIIGLSIVKSLNSGAEDQTQTAADGGDGAPHGDASDSQPGGDGKNKLARDESADDIYVGPDVAPGAPPRGESASPPAMTTDAFPLPAKALAESEADSGAPSVFPGEIEGGESSISIPLPPSDPLIVFAPAPSSLVAVGKTIYDSKTGAEAGQTGAFLTIDRDAFRAPSPDGKYYAAAKESGASGIEVRSGETGELRFTLTLDSSALKLKLLAFGEPGQLISGGRFGAGQRVQIWDLSDGTLAKEIQTEKFERHQAALNDNASALAVATADEGIIIYDLRRSRNQQAGERLLQIPVSPSAGGSAAVDGLRFSPDGEELLAVVDGGAKILCWNESGDVVFEELSAVDMRAVWTGACVYQGPAIEWHPGGRGWLLNGHFFFERQLRRVTWMLETERDEEASMRFLDADRLLCLRGRGHERKLADITIPWDRIDAALRAVNTNQPRHLGPGASVSLQVQVGRVLPGASEKDVRSAIEYIIGKRLEAERISVAAKQPTQLLVNYFEEQSRGSPAKQCELKLRMLINNGARDVFTANVVADAEGEGVEMRQVLYWHLANRLRQTPLPYFIPKSGQLTSLPAIIRP